MNDEAVKDVNQYNITGVLTDDPLGFGPEKKNPVILFVRTTSAFTRADGSEGEARTTHRVTAWGPHAEEALRLREGDRAEITGEMRRERLEVTEGEGEGEDEKKIVDFRSTLHVAEKDSLRRV